MLEEYKKKIGIPEKHTLKQTSFEWQAKKGQDTDTYHYDHLDENGELVGKYIVYDSTSMYPPFGRSISWKHID
ncbi:hypothetical protein [Aeromonas sobria]|uniref:hypothetical protein n=1 Tax=Aeromonas sobria TaxID=646 RepID=UPI003F3605F5